MAAPPRTKLASGCGRIAQLALLSCCLKQSTLGAIANTHTLPDTHTHSGSSNSEKLETHAPLHKAGTKIVESCICSAPAAGGAARCVEPSPGTRANREITRDECAVCSGGRGGRQPPNRPRPMHAMRMYALHIHTQETRQRSCCYYFGRRGPQSREFAPQPLINSTIISPGLINYYSACCAQTY
jgi:hypothetical protein